MPLLSSCPLPPRLRRNWTPFIISRYHCRSIIMSILIKSRGQSFWFDEQVLRDTSDFFAPLLDVL